MKKISAGFIALLVCGSAYAIAPVVNGVSGTEYQPVSTTADSATIGAPQGQQMPSNGVSIDGGGPIGSGGPQHAAAPAQTTDNAPAAAVDGGGSASNSPAPLDQTVQSADSGSAPKADIQFAGPGNNAAAQAQKTAQTLATQNRMSLLNQVNQLQQQLRDLRGQLQTQSHRIDLLQQQQLAHSSTAGAGDAPGSQATAPGGIEVEKVAYQSAYDLIRQHHYDAGIQAMQGYIKDYPAGKYIANAHYWLGELYLAQTKPDLDSATAEFKQVLTYPGNNKIADATLKLGDIEESNHNKEQATVYYNTIIQKYPNTTSADLAKSRLSKLK